MAKDRQFGIGFVLVVTALVGGILALYRLPFPYSVLAIWGVVVLLLFVVGYMRVAGNLP